MSVDSVQNSDWDNCDTLVYILGPFGASKTEDEPPLAPSRMRKDLYSIVVFVLAIWLTFFVDATIPARLTDWGLLPRSLRGLLGVATMPFLHASFGHILSNTVSLFVLLVLLASSRSNGQRIVIAIIATNGLLLWLVGRPYVHVGASGLIFGLITFLIVSGWTEKRPIPIAIALLVGGLYGTTLIGGLIPSWGSEVSWDGHLCGAVSGGVIAYVMRDPSKSHPALFIGKK